MAIAGATNSGINFGTMANLDLGYSALGVTVFALVYPTADQAEIVFAHDSTQFGPNIGYALVCGVGGSPGWSGQLNNGGTDVNYSGGSTVTQNAWSTIGFAYEPSTKNIYTFKNGVAGSTSTASSGLVANNQSGRTTIIGGLDQFNNWFSGRIAWVAVWIGTLTNGEAAAIDLSRDNPSLVRPDRLAFLSFLTDSNPVVDLVSGAVGKLTTVTRADDQVPPNPRLLRYPLSPDKWRLWGGTLAAAGAVPPLPFVVDTAVTRAASY